MKRTIRLSESDLHRVIKESIKGILSEGEAWANQPPIDEFHPDWWYYRQEVEPEGLEDFDPSMYLSDEEYDEHLRQEFGESNESVNRTIRLSESDLHNMVKAAINEVLDNLDDTEKSYWLMRQRQERPNTKAKKPVDYKSEFANQFNKTMPLSNCHQDGVNHGFTSWTPGQRDISGTVTYGVNPGSGEFHSETYGKDFTYGGQNIGNNGETGYVRQGANGKIQKFNGQNREVDRNVSSSANSQANRYRAMRDKYNQQYPNQQG